MTGKQLLLVIAVVLIILCTIVVIVQARVQRQRQEARRKSIIRSLLETAQEQNEIFDINVLDKSAAHKGLAALLQTVSHTVLGMEILGFLSQELTGMSVEVYFRATLPEGPSFYKFRSTILSIESGREKSRLHLASPEDLDAGQKRLFIRIKPPKEKVRVIGVWELDPNKPMPRNTAEISRPLLHYRSGMEKESIQVENISATGMALRFPMEDLEVKPVDLDKGSQLLCLVIYCMGQGRKNRYLLVHLQSAPRPCTRRRRTGPRAWHRIYQLGRAGTGQVGHPLVPQPAGARGVAHNPVGHAYGHGAAQAALDMELTGFEMLCTSKFSSAEKCDFRRNQRHVVARCTCMQRQSVYTFSKVKCSGRPRPEPRTAARPARQKRHRRMADAA